jgi:hypothetical protein
VCICFWWWLIGGGVIGGGVIGGGVIGGVL